MWLAWLYRPTRFEHTMLNRLAAVRPRASSANMLCGPGNAV
jgi:hypothetical protein